MNIQSRFKLYLVLILLAGVALALAIPVLAQAHASGRGDPLSPTAADDIIYVAKSGDGSDGSTWAKAYTDLQDALESKARALRICRDELEQQRASATSARASASFV